MTDHQWHTFKQYKNTDICVRYIEPPSPQFEWISLYLGVQISTKETDGLNITILRTIVSVNHIS